jgi:hypothetical protein
LKHYALYLLLASSSFASAQTLDNSRDVIKSLAPLKNPIGVLLWKLDPQSVNIANRQLQAIFALANNHAVGDVTLLIPYLNYPSSPVEAIAVGPPTKTEDVNRTKRIWPTFAAILNNPYAARELTLFALNKTNPLDMRLTAWIVLRYVSIGDFQDFAKNMSNEFATASPKIRNDVALIAKGRVRFMGMVEEDNK